MWIGIQTRELAKETVITTQAEPHDILQHRPPTWEKSYNERLFGGHFRGWFHRQRFEWAIKKARLRSACDSIFEIGCYDGRLVRLLTPRPSLYVGIDADADNQISQARERFASNSFLFVKGNSPRDITIPPHLRFDAAFALEVVYYLSDELLDEYAKFVAERCNGPFVVTTLNESGPFWLARYLLRRLGMVERTISTYSLSEIANTSVGRIEKIPRCIRKGFDSRKVAEILSRYFYIEVFAGLPFGLPPIFDVYSGIVAIPRR